MFPYSETGKEIKQMAPTEGSEPETRSISIEMQVHRKNQETKPIQKHHIHTV
jgi:hypothetical protein